jgi:uncharacterized damage-inducible protein DinB
MTVAELVEELSQEARTTRRVLERVPEDRLGWKPHEKSMSLGQLALHIAVVPGRIAELATQSEFDIQTPVPRPEPRSVAEILSALEDSIARATKALGTLSDAMLAQPWRMMNGDREIFSVPRGAFLRNVMLNHWYHHRGQLTVYLRQTGALVPSVYGPSADENPFTG